MGKKIDLTTTQLIEERFLAKVQVQANGCWNWTGSLDTSGYGSFGIGSRTDGSRKTIKAATWAYQHWVGLIPIGLQLDHLCRNRPCVNYQHLEPVTTQENTRRGTKANQTHCLRGHPLIEENIYRGMLGQRICRICVLAKQKERRAKRKLTAA